MKKSIKVRSAAKVNLTLYVMDKRADGYHDLHSIMQSVGLYEYVSLTINNSENITISCGKDGIPCDERNIAVKCAYKFFDKAEITPTGLHIDIQKNIPVQAGLAGGSADGAAVLRGLNEMYDEPLSEDELLNVGLSVGADIPFCLSGGTMLAEGVGDILTPLAPISGAVFVIVKPEIGISTADAYRAVDSFDKRAHIPNVDTTDIISVSAALHNDFEEALSIPAINELTDKLRLYSGCMGACMSGSGSAVFGLFNDLPAAERCLEDIKKYVPFAALALPVLQGTEII